MRCRLNGHRNSKWTRRLVYKDCAVLGGFGFNARFLQEAKIPKPIDKAVLPRPERSIVPIG